MPLNQVLFLLGIALCLIAVVIMAVIQLKLMSRYGPKGALSRRVSHAEFNSVKRSSQLFLLGAIILVVSIWY